MGSTCWKVRKPINIMIFLFLGKHMKCNHTFWFIDFRSSMLCIRCLLRHFRKTFLLFLFPQFPLFQKLQIYLILSWFRKLARRSLYRTVNTTIEPKRNSAPKKIIKQKKQIYIYICTNLCVRVFLFCIVFPDLSTRTFVYILASINIFAFSFTWIYHLTSWLILAWSDWKQQ